VVVVVGFSGVGAGGLGCAPSVGRSLDV